MKTSSMSGDSVFTQSHEVNASTLYGPESVCVGIQVVRGGVAEASCIGKRPVVIRLAWKNSDRLREAPCKRFRSRFAATVEQVPLVPCITSAVGLQAGY